MRDGAKSLDNRPQRGGSIRSRGFGRDSCGATAIEFAILAVPLLLWLFGTLEVGLWYLANGSLENAVAKGARVIRTGEAQGQGFDAGRFKTEVCNNLPGLLSCDRLKLDVRTFSSFGGADLTNPSEFNYQPGVGGDVVIVRGIYEWDFPAKLPIDDLGEMLGLPEGSFSLGEMQNGNLLLKATQVFRNEPFK
jgi:Flp pilus assembly protein TadG